MTLINYITPELTVCNDIHIHNKKQALEEISQLISKVNENIKTGDVLSALLQRERLGSTSIGYGIAIPHARVANLDEPLCTLMTLKNAIRFDADTKTAVDIVFGLVVPEEATEQHVKLLSELAEKLQDKSFRKRLRSAQSNAELYHILTET